MKENKTLNPNEQKCTFGIQNKRINIQSIIIEWNQE